MIYWLLTGLWMCVSPSTSWLHKNSAETITALIDFVTSSKQKEKKKNGTPSCLSLPLPQKTEKQSKNDPPLDTYCRSPSILHLHSCCSQVQFQLPHGQWNLWQIAGPFFIFFCVFRFRVPLLFLTCGRGGMSGWRKWCKTGVCWVRGDIKTETDRESTSSWHTVGTWGKASKISLEFSWETFGHQINPQKTSELKFCVENNWADPFSFCIKFLSHHYFSSWRKDEFCVPGEVLIFFWAIFLQYPFIPKLSHNRRGII